MGRGNGLNEHSKGYGKDQTENDFGYRDKKYPVGIKWYKKQVLFAWVPSQSEAKLKEIKKKWTKWNTSNRCSRKEETALCRLRIGHCELSHVYLLKRLDPPTYEICMVQRAVNCPVL